ncbi:sugar phosphate isomerase/epimerase family protein [Pedobacter insulae]|uniref:Sugar phosphate isomerase/epimerase n=1 Tax=Pedobacter insulae TaxID=414048 RepID=A0A1I2TVJ4_9SPHI|nr:sugar phosphate isomerase/epimerase [Pedobacter insulae]SFG66556.1 Sugar phosphate isomerase/epimerase [Pedobacter insulae]
MNSRRAFIKQTSLLAASAVIIPSFANCMYSQKRAVGLQLYSLRDIIGKDITGIIEKVAGIGYKEVETYGYNRKDGFWGLDAKAFANLLKQNGLKSPSGHFDMDGFISGKGSDSLKSYIEAANIIDCKYITVPYLGGQRKTADDYKRIANKLNEAGTLCKASGLKLAYHNHDFEFAKFGDTTGLGIMLDESDKNLVDFELDIYWAVRSGVDPLTLFKAHPKRFTMWHVKDMDKSNKNLNTEIGQGAIDFKSIFAEAKSSGLKHLFVEHETNYKPDQMGSVKTSFDYVNTL